MSESEKIDYESIFQHAPIGMCISQHRIIHACNNALTAMFGYADAPLTGLSFAVLYPTYAEFERTDLNTNATKLLHCSIYTMCLTKGSLTNRL
jgi:PAS domain S-box-containing protein